MIVRSDMGSEAHPSRALRLPQPEVFSLPASDGVVLRLTRFDGGGKGPVLVVHCIGVSSRMYLTTSVDTNLVEHLYADGFDVWLLDMRLSIDLESSREQSTLDDVATKDYPAAVAHVLEQTGSETLQVVAHGVGSSTFTMAMLSGLAGVRAAVCSQVSTHVLIPLWSRLKSPSVTAMARMGVTTISPSDDDAWLWRFSDHTPRLGARCHDRVCRRITTIFGPLYEHAQFSDGTHAELRSLFGTVNLTALSQLSLLGRRRHLVSSTGEERYLPHLDRLAIPIAYLHGEANRCVLPKSTETTLGLVRAANGGSLYRRSVFAGYGHVDCVMGKDAVRDVFPVIVDHLNAN
jgi:cholesterol oxidase